jgi:hypothetical protein
MREKLCAAFLLVSAVLAQPPVPSEWKGEAKGSIREKVFTLPVSIELKSPPKFDNNAFRFFIGSADMKRLGDFLVLSSAEVATGGTPVMWKWSERVGAPGIYKQIGPASQAKLSSGAAVLQYFTIQYEGAKMIARLAGANTASAAAANSFVGPNVSALEASAVMRGVMDSLGPTEVFIFGKGATVTLEFTPDAVTGVIAGEGRSVTNTSSGVHFHCRLTARRVK